METHLKYPSPNVHLHISPVGRARPYALLGFVSKKSCCNGGDELYFFWFLASLCACLLWIRLREQRKTKPKRSRS